MWQKFQKAYLYRKRIIMLFVCKLTEKHLEHCCKMKTIWVLQKGLSAFLWCICLANQVVSLATIFRLSLRCLDIKEKMFLYWCIIGNFSYIFVTATCSKLYFVSRRMERGQKLLHSFGTCNKLFNIKLVSNSIAASFSNKFLCC